MSGQNYKVPHGIAELLAPLLKFLYYHLPFSPNCPCLVSIALHDLSFTLLLFFLFLPMYQWKAIGHLLTDDVSVQLLISFVDLKAINYIQ